LFTSVVLQKKNLDMKKTIHIVLCTTISTLYCLMAFAGKSNTLNKCWNIQAKPFVNTYHQLNYTEVSKDFYHSFSPWKELIENKNGSFTFTTKTYSKVDTLLNKTKLYTSEKHYKDHKLLYKSYNAEKASIANEKNNANALFESLRYSPVLVLNYFFEHQKSSMESIQKDTVCYKLYINEILVSLYIKKDEPSIHKVTCNYYDELYGDIIDVYYYEKYQNINSTLFLGIISVHKLNGLLKDEIKVSSLKKINTPEILKNDFNLFEVKKDTTAILNISVEKFDEHIYFIILHHLDTKIMLVEFEDFALIADAPFNSSNAEQIMKEVKKLIGDKAIRYFSYGHFHNYYAGGMRAFVHKGSTILHGQGSGNYLQYIVNAKHSLRPDSLELEPRLLKSIEIKDSMTIKDNNTELCIYKIGMDSEHTIDYLVYYFPKHKLLFEDDLVWIKKSGAITKASKRQAGLYHAIVKRNLAVDTIIQSWPLKEYDVKTKIPFSELEKSVLSTE
jgi:hypothetical protein